MRIGDPILERLRLLRTGYSKGVSINWLSKNNNHIFSNTHDFLESNIFYAKYFERKNLDLLSRNFKKILDNASKITSTHWNSQVNLCALIYSFIIKNHIQVVIETGVANGISTNVILSALRKTGGKLHSFDVLPSAQNSVTDQSNWTFHLLSQRTARSELEKKVNKIGKCDLWLHDSNHGFNWQLFEYQLAIENLSKKGFLFSDDIDASPAWGYFSAARKQPSIAIFDKRKFIGFTIKN